MLNNLTPMILFGVLCPLSSMLLVRILKYDLRFDKTIDFYDYYWHHPLVARVVSIWKLAMRYWVLAYLLSTVLLWIGGRMGDRLGWLAFPPLGFLDLWRWAIVKDLDVFWQVCSGWVVVIALNDARRCARRPIWDVFISYKSEDVHTARLIADQLIASGLRVWFAEYQVLLQNYEEFQDAIDYGIRNSANGILFTNNRYIGSPYCRDEVEKLLAHLGPGKLMEIMIPREDLPRRHYPDLENCPSHVGDDALSILSFLREQTGWPVRPVSTLSRELEERRLQTTFQGRPMSVNVAGWEVTDPGHQSPDSGMQGLELRSKLPENDFHLFVNLYYGSEIHPEAQRVGQPTNDRDVYKMLLDHAKGYVRKLGADMRGLHLLFHYDLSQFALTYWLDFYWTRKYSVIIPNEVLATNAEFVFTFGFVGTSFKDYCRYAHLMDRLVASLQWGDLSGCDD